MATNLPNPYDYDPEEWAGELHTELLRGRARREAKRILDEEAVPVAEAPPIETLQVRLERPRTPTKFRIEGWQPEGGRVVLAAQAKGGKTHASHNLARVLVDGGRWLGRWPVNRIRGTVAILDFELSEATAEDWLQRQGIKNLDRVALCALRGKAATFNILDVSTRAAWAQKLAEVGTDYVVLDCLRPVLDAIGLDEHKDAGKFLNAFDALLHEAGIGEALVIHHMGHGGERSRGDSRIIDWPDATWRLTLDNIVDPSSPRFIAAFGRDVEIEEHRLSLDKDTRHLKAIVESGLENIEEALRLVLQWIQSQGEAQGARAIEGALRSQNVARQSVRDALRVGVRRGWLTQEVGAHNTALYAIAPMTWARRLQGGEGEEDHPWG